VCFNEEVSVASFTVFVETNELGLSQNYQLGRVFVNVEHPPKMHEFRRLDPADLNIWGKVVGTTGKGDAQQIYVRVSLVEFALLYRSRAWGIIKRP